MMSLPIAEGAIEAKPEQGADLDQLTRSVTEGNFFVPVTSTVPTKCIDGRPGARGFAPNTAGGSESFMVAMDLLGEARGLSTAEAYAKALDVLLAKGLPVGGHTDDHAHGALSGCGANDKLSLIYDFLVRKADEIRKIAESVGVMSSDTVFAQMIENARLRTEFSDGAELLSVLREKAGDDVVDPLRGAHNEVLTVINTQSGTTLDRVAVAEAFGFELQVFNVDAWSIRDLATTVGSSDDESSAYAAAMVYYNLATAGVLCGVNMRVVVR